jgi:hypothetical protein
MADKDVTLGIQMDTASLKAGAESGAKALADLENQIKGDTQALAQMQKAMKDLQGGTVVNVEQFKKLQAGIDAKKQSIATARSAFLSLGGTFEKNRRGGKSLQAQLAELAKTTQGMPGPIGSVVAVFGRLVTTIANNPIKTALVGIAAAMLGVQVKLVSFTIALTRYAIAQADARRSELLRLEGLTKIRNYYGVAAGSAQDLQDSIDKVSASSALSRDQIAGLATQLYKAHFRGEALTDALDAAAIKTSTQGQEQASMWIGYAEAINRTGGNVKGFAQNVRNQLGGIAQKQMLSLDVQAKKLEESYAALTTGIRIEPLLKAKAGFNALFAQSTASGRALKVLLGTLIQPIINQITRVIPIAKRFFQGLILAALEFGLAVLEVADMFGVKFGTDVPDAVGDAEWAVTTGKAAFDLLAGSMWALLTVTGLVGAKMTWLAIKSIPGLVRALIPVLASIWSQVVAWGAWALEMLITLAPLLLIIAAVALLVVVINELVQAWKEIDFKLLFQYMFEGFAEGWAKVKDGIKGIATSVVDIFKSVFKVRSPSKVFEEIGANLGEGLQLGIDSTAPDVNQSVEHLVDVPQAPAGGGRGGASPAAAGAPAGGTVIIQAINLQGYADPAQAAKDFVSQLAKTLRVAGFQLGAPGDQAA